MAPQIEKASINITIVSVLLVVIALATFTYRVGQEVADIKNRVESIECDISEANEKILLNEKRSHASDIKLAEISTDLKNITAMLVKIQEKI